MVKSFMKKIVPPSTSMMDARLAELKRENELLRDELASLRSEFSDALRYIHADYCSSEISSAFPREDNRPFVLSVATYAPRFSSIAQVFRALHNQSIRPVETHVWIPRSDAPEGMASLPHSVLSAFSEWGGVTLHWVEDDLGPHNKYYWLMANRVEFPVVTIDDDAVLPAGLFESLWTAHVRHPDCVIASRTHEIVVQEEGDRTVLTPYSSWHHEQSSIVDTPSHRLLPTGLGGVLYPVGCLPECAFDSEAIRQTCLYGDDLWLKVMEVLGGVRVVDCGFGFVQNLVDGSQECALHHQNLSNNRNDTYLRHILAYVDADENLGVSSEQVLKAIDHG